MLIRRLEISGVRNLTQAKLWDLSQINILYGVNGAGKTSILESIHLLSSAKSFRSHKLVPIINKDSDSCVVFGEVSQQGDSFQPVGVERYRSKGNPPNIKISGKTVNSAAELADRVPLQVICADTFGLLEGAPIVRRRYLDWGVFHVEHSFNQVWKSAQRCLKQRNTLLRHDRIDPQQLALWTSELARAGELLDQLRDRYIKRLIPIFEQTISKLITLEGLQISYYRGWDKERSLEQVLNDNLMREIEQGHTISGPHRADIKFRYQSGLAADILSRGQQKLVICALRVAQGYLLSTLVDKRCAFLIDDLPAELDVEHRKALCRLLEELKSQIFITCVNHQDIADCWSDKTKIRMFHVEHGNIQLVNK